MRTSTVVLLACVLCVAFASVASARPQLEDLSESAYQDEFTSFMNKFKREYSDDEYFARYEAFKLNFDRIRSHNALYEAGEHSFFLAVNNFADWTEAERQIMHEAGRKNFPKHTHRLPKKPENSSLEIQPFIFPPNLDYRSIEMVTPVKDQLQAPGVACDASWAFSAVGAVESVHGLNTADLVAYSEQQVLGCNTVDGCTGNMEDTFTYIIRNPGIATEASYPYTGPSTTCLPHVNAFSQIVAYTVLPNAEASFLTAVQVAGPISIAVQSTFFTFVYYGGGVYSDIQCGVDLDHGMVVTGYGTDVNNLRNYWLTKNSWGTSWGEAGYIRLQYGVNQCGMGQAVSYPTTHY